MVNLFNMFITYGDTFLPTSNSYDELYYEIVRMHQVFDNLYCMGRSDRLLLPGSVQAEPASCFPSASSKMNVDMNEGETNSGGRSRRIALAAAVAEPHRRSLTMSGNWWPKSPPLCGVTAPLLVELLPLV